MSAIRRTVRLWCSVVVLLVMCVIVGCGAYLRLGTTFIQEFPSPDGNWDAVLMVRNGGAMTGYATVVSVNGDYWLARQFALFGQPLCSQSTTMAGRFRGVIADRST
jgi:hypothetical protein